MISDSVPWRAELHRSAQRLRRRLTQRRWSEQTSFLVERDLMIGMFSVRRLVEAEKTSTLLIRRRIKVGVCPLTGAEPHHLERWAPWDNYDFESRQRAEVDLKSLYEEFIHSFIFTLGFDEADALAAVYVASDRTKQARVYEVSIQDIIDLFHHVASEHVVWTSWHRLNGGGKGYRLSQHDLVEAGLVESGNASHYQRLESSPITRAFLAEKFPGMKDQPDLGPL